jgi:hypothetical protein
MGARLGLPLELAQNDLPVTDVLNDPRRHAVQTDKAEAAHDLLDREQARQVFLVAQAVLQREHRCAGSDERRQQFGERLVGSGLEPDEDEVSGTDFFWEGAPRLDLEIAFGAADQDALPPHGLVIRAQQEMDLVPGARQLGAVKAPDRTAADDRDSSQPNGVEMELLEWWTDGDLE